MAKEIFSNLSDEQAWDYRTERLRSDPKVSSYPQLEGKTGPDTEYDPRVVKETFDRLLAAEDEIAPGSNYEEGSALSPDGVLRIDGNNQVLLTAEHATIQQRNGEPKEADMGTGGLARVVATDTNSTALIANGRQTSDANYVSPHPFKSEMADVLRDPENRSHFGLHMLDRGRASEPEQTRGYSILLGIGDDPSEATLEVKDQLLGIASDFDLKIGVNAPHIVIAQKQLRRNPDGSLKTVTFKGAGANTTRTFSQELARELGKDEIFAAIQIEINEVLVARQNDDPGFPSDYEQYLGGYLGYMFVRKAVGTIALL